MHKNLLKETNLIKVMMGTFYILLQRDMSLNRRIYEWYFGTNKLHRDRTTDTNEQNQIDDLVEPSPYFLTYTKDILIQSLKTSLETIVMKPAEANMKSDYNISSSSLPSSTWTLTKLIRVLLMLSKYKC